MVVVQRMNLLNLFEIHLSPLFLILELSKSSRASANFKLAHELCAPAQ